MSDALFCSEHQPDFVSPRVGDMHDERAVVWLHLKLIGSASVLIRVRSRHSQPAESRCGADCRDTSARLPQELPTRNRFHDASIEVIGADGTSPSSRPRMIRSRRPIG
jgi:hypothetical protein